MPVREALAMMEVRGALPRASHKREQHLAERRGVLSPIRLTAHATLVHRAGQPPPRQPLLNRQSPNATTPLQRAFRQQWRWREHTRSRQSLGGLSRTNSDLTSPLWSGDSPIGSPTSRLSPLQVAASALLEGVPRRTSAECLGRSMRKSQSEIYLPDIAGRTQTPDHSRQVLNDLRTATGSNMQPADAAARESKPRSVAFVSDQPDESENGKFGTSTRRSLSSSQTLHAAASERRVSESESSRPSTEGADPVLAAALSNDSGVQGFAPPKLNRVSSAALLQEDDEEYRDRSVQAWEFLQVGHALCRDTAEAMLKRLGHREPKKPWIDDIIKESCDGRWHLDLDDSVELAVQYRRLFIDEIEQILGNTDPSAECPPEASNSLLNTLRTRPLPGVAVKAQSTVGLRKIAVSSATPEDNRELSLTAKISDIMLLRDTLIDHAGMSPAEYSRVMGTFHRYDQDRDGTLNNTELRLALTWLGADVDYARDVTAGLPDVDTEAFMEVIKKFFEKEEKRIRKAFELADANSNNVIERSELEDFFENLGHYSCTQAVLDEVLQLCGMAKRECVDFDDIYQVFMKYRERNGFLETDLDEIKEAFENLDHDKSGSMDASELETAVYWLGYPSSFAMVREVLDIYDIDESGDVDSDEFTGFVAKYRDKHMAEVRRVFFAECLPEEDSGDDGEDVSEDKSACLPVPSLRKALQELGFTDVHLEDKTPPDCTELSLEQFVCIETACRREVCVKARQNQCFSDEEVKVFRDKFMSYVKGDTEEIVHSEVSKLFEELYPDIRVSRETHAKARRLLEASDENGDGKIDFLEFLRMMRLFRYEVREFQINQEREAIEHTGFSKEEVQGFREAFKVFDADGSGDLQPDEFLEMIQQLAPVTKETVDNLVDKVEQVDTNGGRQLGFPEFLRIMKVLGDKM